MANPSDAKRHESKINKFKAAVGLVGFDRLVTKIGKGATSAFVCAQDAMARRQGPEVVAGFLSDAQGRAEEFCNLQPDEDVYGVIANLR